MRENKEATLAIWDYMHSVGVRNKIAALNGDVLMYVFPPEDFDTITGYIDYPDSKETDTAEFYTDNFERSKNGVDEMLDLAADMEKRAREEWEDFDGGPEESEAY